MDIRIGLTDNPRELEIELADDTNPEQVSRQVTDAITGSEPVLSFTDRRGREVLVAAARIAWVEIGTPSERRVGFGG